MPLLLRPITPADSLSWIRVRSLANYGPTHALLHSGPISESSIIKTAQDRKPQIGKPNTWHWKIVDTDLSPSPSDPDDNGGLTIAIAVYTAHNIDNNTKETKPAGSDVPTSLIAEEKAEKKEEMFLAPELRRDALNALMTPLNEAQKEIMGTQPYLMLDSLATHPDHHRRGAGTILLEWGVKKADKEGLVMYLLCTTVGRRMYEKVGFELVKGFEFDRVPWGGEGKDWHGCMVRWPRSAAA